MGPSDSKEGLFRAIHMGSAKLVRELIARQPELLESHAAEHFGATPLTAACFARQHEVALALLELGADPNQRSHWNMGPWSPMDCAAHLRDHALGHLLLTHGALLDAHGAAGLGKHNELKRLLEAEPLRVHERGGDGCLPLHFADTEQVADLLLSHGADINARCVDHFSTPVQYLCTVRPHVAQHLYALGATPDLFSALAAGAEGVVQTLLSQEPGWLTARIDQTTFPPSREHDVHNILTFTLGSGFTPLHTAAKTNRADLIARLIQAGHEMNSRGGYDDSTPLHVAAWDNCVAATEKLLQLGADINIRSGALHHNTPAGWAIVAGSAEVFELLLKHGAERFPWFLNDARLACEGAFQGIKATPLATRAKILARLEQAE